MSVDADNGSGLPGPRTPGKGFFDPNAQVGEGQTDGKTSIPSAQSVSGMVWGPKVAPSTAFHGSADASSRWAQDWTNSQSNTWLPKSQAEALFSALPEDQQRLFNNIAGASKSGMDTGESVYRKYVAASAAYSAGGKRYSPAELALRDLQQGSVPGMAGSPGDGSSSGGGSGSGGPSTSIRTDHAPALDVRAIADGVAQEMLGRVVTDDEMKRILKRVRKYETANPSISQGVSGGGTSISESSGGATTAGRQEIVKRLMVQNPDFMPYQMDHTVYDALLSVMKQGQEIANG